MSSEISKLINLLDQFLERKISPLEFRDEMEKLVNRGISNGVSEEEWMYISHFIQKMDAFSSDLPVASTLVSRLSRAWKSVNGEPAYSEEGLRCEASDFRARLKSQLSKYDRFLGWFRLPK